MGNLKDNAQPGDCTIIMKLPFSHTGHQILYWPYLFVVIQHSVHILNPNSVHWPVKNEPLAIGSLRGGKCPVGHSQDTI